MQKNASFVFINIDTATKRKPTAGNIHTFCMFSGQLAILLWFLKCSKSYVGECLCDEYIQ